MQYTGYTCCYRYIVYIYFGGLLLFTLCTYAQQGYAFGCVGLCMGMWPKIDLFSMYLTFEKILLSVLYYLLMKFNTPPKWFSTSSKLYLRSNSHLFYYSGLWNIVLRYATPQGPFTLDTRTEFSVHSMHIGCIHTWIRFGALQIECALKEVDWWIGTESELNSLFIHRIHVTIKSCTV